MRASLPPAAHSTALYSTALYSTALHSTARSSNHCSRAPSPRLLVAALCLVALAACDPYDSYCGRVEQCANDDEDGYEQIRPDDDYRATCAAQLRAQERVLRANEEPECQLVADAYRAYIGCLSGLDCKELNDEVREADACEDQRDELSDVTEDADGECQGMSFGCSNAPMASLFAFLALLGLRRRRR